MNRSTTETRKIYIGTRKVSNQNFSKIMAIPKSVLTNCGDPSHFEIYLILEGDTKSVLLVPIRKKES